jgi:hypothetical protein
MIHTTHSHQVCTAILKTFKAALEQLLREKFSGGKSPKKSFLVDTFCREITNACEKREIPSEARERAEKEREENIAARDEL